MLGVNSEWKVNKVLCTASTISDTCAANSLHLISPAGGDYTPVATDLTFSSTNAAISQTVTIPILDDLLLEGSEIFNVTLATNNSDVMLLPNLGTVTIEDVEGKLQEEIDYFTIQRVPLVKDTLKHQVIRAPSLTILYDLIPSFISKEPGSSSSLAFFHFFRVCIVLAS